MNCRMHYGMVISEQYQVSRHVDIQVYIHVHKSLNNDSGVLVCIASSSLSPSLTCLHCCLVCSESLVTDS